MPSPHATKQQESPIEMSILRLPTELIEQIVDKIAPDTHLSFALACRLLRDCSRSTLAHHRACSIKNKEITDVFENFSRPKDPVAAWHNRACVVYRATSIKKALQISTFRSLEIRRFDDEYGRGNFEEEVSLQGCKSPITELYFHYVPIVSESQLRGLFSSCQALKIINVDKCSFQTANLLVELATTYHGKTIEVIHFGKNQEVRGGSDHRLYHTPHLNSLENIRHLVVHLQDIYDWAAAIHWSRKKLLSGKGDRSLHKALAECFLPSLHSLEIRITSLKQPPNTHEIEELDSAFSDALSEKSRLLKRLDLSGVEHEYCYAKLFDTGGRYLNRLFPHVGGHYVSAAAIGALKLYPLFTKTIETGHRLGIMVKTFHHHRGNCERCHGLEWSGDLEMYDSFERLDTKEVCGSLKCEMCARNIFLRDAYKVLKPGRNGRHEK